MKGQSGRVVPGFYVEILRSRSESRPQDDKLSIGMCTDYRKLGLVLTGGDRGEDFGEDVQDIRNAKRLLQLTGVGGDLAAFFTH